jgi:hypothetical protein
VPITKNNNDFVLIASLRPDQLEELAVVKWAGARLSIMPRERSMLLDAVTENLHIALKGEAKMYHLTQTEAMNVAFDLAMDILKNVVEQMRSNGQLEKIVQLEKQEAELRSMPMPSADKGMVN